MNKEYLGDGVYIEPWSQGLKLTTDNGIEVTNEIFLEPEIVGNLVKYLEKMVEN